MARKIKRIRRKTGLAGVTPDMLTSFEKLKWYFKDELEKKHFTEVMRPFIKSHFKKDAAAILALPDYKWALFSHEAATVFWLSKGLPESQTYLDYKNHMLNRLTDLIALGKQVVKEKAEEAEAKKTQQVLTIQDRIRMKAQRTVLVDIDEMIDEWIAGEKTERNVFQLFKKHELTANAVPYIAGYLEEEASLYRDALDKSCEQAVEALSHLDRPEQKRRLKVLTDMQADLDKIKSHAILNRKTRTPKPVTADKQIAKLKFCKTSEEFKLDSINPMLIVSAKRLYTFNVKTRVLSVFISESTEGLKVKGATILNYEPKRSLSVKLRKPQDILTVIMSRADKTIDTTIAELKAKKSPVKARITEQHILLRAL
jgi:hypothetical protein